jgi:N-acetylglucosamine repressor
MNKNNLISTKYINKKSIIRILREINITTRSEIARKLKVSRPTIYEYINELIDEGFIIEEGKDTLNNKVGKKSTLIRFNNKAYYIISIMIGVKNTKISITDLKCNILSKKIIKTMEWKGVDTLITKILNGIKDIIALYPLKMERIIGIGIGVPGITNPEKGEVIFLPNLKGWINISLAQIIKSEIKLPVFIENECRVQAIAEKEYGLGIEKSNFICIETGIGIGSGVYLNNQLLVGNGNGHVGAIGHIKIGGNRKCHCGSTGCLESLCSTRALLEDVQKEINEKLDINEVYNLFQNGNESVIECVKKNAENLSIGISNAIKMFNPDLIIIHGSSIKFGEKYLNFIRDRVKKLTYPKLNIEYEIKYSELGEDAGLMGCSELVFENIFQLKNLNIQDKYIIKKI